MDVSDDFAAIVYSGITFKMCVNLKRVCDRVRKQGIDVFGFGLGTDKPGDFYSDKWFVYLKDVLNMGQEFVREFSRIITEGKVKV